MIEGTTVELMRKSSLTARLNGEVNGACGLKNHAQKILDNNPKMTAFELLAELNAHCVSLVTDNMNIMEQMCKDV